MDMHAIGRRIAEMRRQKDMTQLELADKMGVSAQAISSWEVGKTMPDIAKLPDISQVLGITIDELLGNVAHSSIIKNVLMQDGSHEPISAEDLKELAPLLKPSQVESLAEDVEQLTLSDLLVLGPFLGSEKLGLLAKKAEFSTKELWLIAPFLSRQTLYELAAQSIKKGKIKDLLGLAPFLGEDLLGKLVMPVSGNSDNSN